MNGKHDDSTPRDIIVVGAGPTGLLLAGDLAAAGVPVTLVEKREHGISNLSRAFVAHARTLEQLDARGIADALEAKGRPLDRIALFGRLSVRLDTLPSRFNHLLVIPQYEVEKILERRAVEAGVRFRYETEVTAVQQGGGGGGLAGGAGDPYGVTVDVRTADGATDRLTAAYVVGTDGHRSAVRRAVGLSFPGKSVIRSVVLADVRLDEQPEEVLTANAVGDAFAFIAPFGDGYHRVIGWHRGHDVPDSEPLELDEVREITRLALGRDYGMRDARWMSRFHCDERQAPAYRVGRVFLAGDAAHVHTPAGGQGMNTGLQDAANLGWKLAAVLHGHADPALLDSYQAERHPVGRAVLRSSGGIVRLAMAKSPWALALRAALTTFVNHVPPARTRALGQITGIGYTYPAPRGAHRLVGTRVPDVALTTGRLYESLRGGRFVLITPRGTDRPALLGAREGRLAVAAWTSDRRTTVLVRPDGYVAWAAEGADGAAVEAALGEWLGTAAQRLPTG
ncbi:FAD-dependent monooxygenase [Streptomyces caniscabiei]|uniref:FAD-dependent monooxygenase n=1 Tax=Streptomyces caniscabiei TaxID=2746961 RepID=UPI0029A062E1|nr:FAD-dependent monooxygenase [Streptomyces caniscabiei]MDX2598606.1 FAD-dependent monooxygenase [Streptomyces caniscabiei]MDX2736068.1 FAD-dependent monooxygenase [Streptomyces caniscabiei]MDX2778964.1 FAD-dependent monooxygenase [Streptomyces caniscabiei]